MFSTILDRVTYHAVYDDSILGALRFARANGFAGVQVATETPHLAPHRIGPAERREIAAFCAGTGAWLSLHGPDDVASLFAADPALQRGISDHFAALFEFAAEAGARLLTFHPGHMVTYPTATDPRVPLPERDRVLYREAFAENLERVVSLAPPDLLLCIENYRMDREIWDVVQLHLESGRLSLCWDLAKTYRDGRNVDTDLEAFFWGNLASVRQVHLHDLDGRTSHRVIGDGLLDFGRFLPRLAAADVAEFCIEVRPREKAAESLAALRLRAAGW